MSASSARQNRQNQDQNTAGAEFPHPYIEYAVGGAHNRNKLRRIEEFAPDMRRHDVFRSMLRFPEIMTAYMKGNAGSVSGYQGSTLAEFFPADFDHEEEAEKALEDARRTVRRWEALYGLPPDALRYYFSGSKGFHVEVPGDLFGGFEPGKDTAARLKALAQWMLGESSTADMDVYNTTRLWRVPNTKHSGSGRYKVPLSPQEFLTLGMQQIWELVRNPRSGIVFTDPSEFGVVDELEQLWQKTKGADDTRSWHEPLDTAAILNGVPLGERDTTLFKLACKLRGAGVPQDIAERLTVEAAQNCDPPVPEREALQKVKNAYSRYQPNGDPPVLNTTNGSHSYLRTDLGNAERFVNGCRGKAMWCGARRSWLVWDGTRWVWDDRKHIVRMAHRVARTIFADAQHTEDQEEQKQIAKWAMTSQSEARINAMISQAAPYLAVGIEELDTDPWVLNCQNGTLDLKTGTLKKHDPADLITKIVPVEYDPDAKAPRFEQFLRETLVEEDLISFVKRFSGYTLTGVTRERVMTILYGFGKNGKSTLVELLQKVLGDYSTNTDVETLLTKRGGGVPNDVAALKGARFVSAAEVEKGRRLAESKVKQLTGNDTVTARFLHGEFFDFKPEFKLWLSTNNKPEIRGTDDAIWDRIRLIPFTQRFEGSKADPNLPETLREEMNGVLAWLVEGCLEWQEHGLCEPVRVTEATQGYREEMDTLAAFFEEHCVIHPNAEVPATPLFNRYKRWCEDALEPQETQKAFGMRLSERGFESIKLTRGSHKGNKGWRGIGFRVDDPPPDDDDNPTFTTQKAPSEEFNGPPGGPLPADGPLAESGLDMRNEGVGVDEVDHGGPKNDIFDLDHPRVGENPEKRSTSSTSSTPHPQENNQAPQRPVSFDAKPGEDVTVEELQRRQTQQESGVVEESPEDDALLAAGWKQRDRGDNSFWLHPESGFAYSREVALRYIDGNVSAREY